jgi:hypothetical protein
MEIRIMAPTVAPIPISMVFACDKDLPELEGLEDEVGIFYNDGELSAWARRCTFTRQ